MMAMKKTTVLPLVAVLGIAACAGTEINQPPVPYVATKALNAVGSTTFTVRANAKVDGRRTELTGVPCTFQGEGFRSSFTTPAKVISPNMQGRTPPASVSCTYNGATKTRVIEPFNKTGADINSGAMAAGAGAGLVGMIVGGAVAAAQTSARDVSQDVYGYPDVAIDFGG